MKYEFGRNLRDTLRLLDESKSEKNTRRQNITGCCFSLVVLAKSCQPHEAKHAETDRSVSACVADLHARARKAAEGAWVYGEEWSTANVRM